MYHAPHEEPAEAAPLPQSSSTPRYSIQRIFKPPVFTINPHFSAHRRLEFLQYPILTEPIMYPSLLQEARLVRVHLSNYGPARLEHNPIDLTSPDLRKMSW